MLLGEQQRDEFLSLDAQVRGYVSEDRVQRAHPKVGVVRYRDVVLTALLGSEAKVTSCLSRDPITQSFEPTCQVTPREVPR